MLFSELYKIQGNNEWFDPILHQDTKLFIDPFLVFKTEHPYFIKTYENIMWFINKVFELVAKSGGKKGSVHYQKALSMLHFHEVNELCLGYSSNRQGAGPGPGWSKTLAQNINECIKHDIDTIGHIEEIAIFTMGIGPDSISDITANIMKNDFVKYTQMVCEKYNIPTQNVLLKNANFDKRYLKWEHKSVKLPVNPFKKDTGILLTPKSFLCQLPEINTDDFYTVIMQNEILRNDLNFEINENMKKEDITKIALENYNVVEKYVRRVESRNGVPYDILKDPKMLYIWYENARSIVNTNPIKLTEPTTDKEFLDLIEILTFNFKNYVENKSGYKLLWDEKYAKGKSEEAVQLLFHGIVEQYCKANNIDLTREVNQGRGPVDFRFSQGFARRVLLEIKLVRNSKFWNGLEAQLPKYLDVDTCKDGLFLAVIYTKADEVRIKDIKTRVAKVNIERDLNIKILEIDAKPQKLSASKL